jgi:hypothetical protein
LPDLVRHLARLLGRLGIVLCALAAGERAQRAEREVGAERKGEPRGPQRVATEQRQVPGRSRAGEPVGRRRRVGEQQVTQVGEACAHQGLEIGVGRVDQQPAEIAVGGGGHHRVLGLGGRGDREGDGPAPACRNPQSPREQHVVLREIHPGRLVGGERGGHRPGPPLGQHAGCRRRSHGRRRATGPDGEDGRQVGRHPDGDRGGDLRAGVVHQFDRLVKVVGVHSAGPLQPHRLVAVLVPQTGYHRHEVRTIVRHADRWRAVDQHGQLGQVPHVGGEETLRAARPELTVAVGQDDTRRGHRGGEVVDEESAHSLAPILE